MFTEKKILIVVTSHDRIDAQHPTGLWLEEFAIPYQQLKATNYAITVASPKGGPAPIDPRSKPTPEQAAAWSEAQAVLQQTQPLAAIKGDDFAAIFLAGGHGTMFDLPTNPDLQRLLGQFAADNKVIAAVCHGPAGLVGATLPDGKPLVSGRVLTAFTNAEERAAELDTLMPFLLESKMRELGAEFVTAPNWADHVEQDGKLITGQNPQSSAGVAGAIISALNRYLVSI